MGDSGEGRHYPVLTEKHRDLRMSFLKRSMKNWKFRDFKETIAKIKADQSRGGQVGDVEHSRSTTDNMLRWQAIRELLEERLCTSNCQ
jgi:hypothetical protein